MCFSASTSFGVSAILLAGGVATLREAKTPKQIPFAAIPVVFAIQQFTEGFVWLSLTRQGHESMGIGFTYAFLLFAQVLWPSLVPYSVYLMEEDPERKKHLRWLMISGILLSAYLLFSLFYYPVSARVSDHHIRYELDRPVEFMYVTAAVYFISTIIPPFISSIKRMLFVAFFSLASFVVTVLFFSEYLISVWCFFAATISISVFFTLKSNSLKIETYKTA